jgi:hypothetical protein
MNAFFMMYRIWFQIGAVAILLAGFSWGVHSYNEHFRDIGKAEVRAEWDAANAKAKVEADKQEAAWNKRLEEANANFTKRQEAQTVALAATTAANNSLSGAITRLRNGVSNTPPSTSANAALALATVFGDCSTKYIGMAEIAGRHSNDLQRILDQWPTNKVK